MENYHGIVVDASQENKDIFSKLKVIGQKKDEDWILYKIEVGADVVDNVINQLQGGMKSGFYFHFYKDDELLVVFKDKIFRVKTDNSTWGEIINYGKSLDIPEEQLDFFLCKVEDEKY